MAAPCLTTITEATIPKPSSCALKTCLGDEDSDEVMTIVYAWSPSGDINACDYDSGVTWLGATVGWQCPFNQYLEWGGDIITCGTGEESTTVRLKCARDDGKWTTDTTQIILKGDWWTSRPRKALQVDFQVKVTVTWLGVTKTKIYNSPDEEQNCPVHTIGFVDVNWPDGTFSMS